MRTTQSAETSPARACASHGGEVTWDQQEVPAASNEILVSREASQGLRVLLPWRRGPCRIETSTRANAPGE